MKKTEIIEKIKKIVNDYGTFTTADAEADSSPCIATLGNDTCQLIEEFGMHKVTAVTYVHESEVNEDFILYEDLKINILKVILLLAKKYETIMIEDGKE